MKIIKLITTLLFLFALTGAIAQNNVDILKTRTTKTFEFEKNGKKIPYRITIYKTSRSKVELEKKDKNKINQSVKTTPEQVTKLIYIDNDMYSDYDKYIVLRYTKDAKDSFELKPTKRGFSVIVDNKNVEYIFGEGVYFVNNDDKDFFFIDEFDSI